MCEVSISERESINGGQQREAPLGVGVWLVAVGQERREQ
jgi:hypothetical protein